MPGHVAMTTESPAKMRGKNLRFLPTSFPFHATDTAAYSPPAFYSPHTTPHTFSPFHPHSLSLSLLLTHHRIVVCRAGIYNIIMEL